MESVRLVVLGWATAATLIVMTASSTAEWLLVHWRRATEAPTGVLLLVRSCLVWRSVPKELARLVVRVGDPDDQVLARTDQHAIDMAKLDGGHSGWVEVEQAHLVSRLDVPDHDLLLGCLAARDQVTRVWTKAGLKNGPGRRLIEVASELMLQLTFERVDEDDYVLCGAEEDKLAIWTELHLLDLRGPILVVDREDRERPLLVILRIKQMHLLDGPSACATATLTCRLLAIFEVETGQNHARVIEAAGSALVYPDLALLAFVVPDARRLIAGAGDEG